MSDVRQLALRPWHPPGKAPAMMLFRLVFGLLLLAAIVCFGLFALHGDPRWRRWGLVTLKWTVLAGLAFFAVIFLERLAVLL
jgi:hypothetical protein